MSFVRIIPSDPAKPGDRLRIERAEGQDDCYLCEERVLPSKVSDPNANAILETYDALWLTPDQQRWLYEQLGELLGANR